MRKLKGIVVHHSDTETGNAESFKRYHISIGWRTIGYHFVILKDGTLEVGRSLSQKGAHCRGNNSTIGIVLVGKLENKAPTPEQYSTLIRLLGMLCFFYNWDSKSKYTHKGKEVNLISGHKDFNSTDCPGDVFYKLLPSIRSAVNSKVKDIASL